MVIFILVQWYSSKNLEKKTLVISLFFSKNENNKNSRSNLKLSLTESKVKNTEICKQKSIPQREEFSSFEHEGGSQFSNYSGDTADKIQSLTDSRSTPVYIVTPADDIISMNDHSEISSLNANLEQNLNFGRQKMTQDDDDKWWDPIWHALIRDMENVKI